MRNEVALSKKADPFKASGAYSFSVKSMDSQVTIERPIQNIAGKGKRKKRERTGKAGKQGGECVLFLSTVLACHYIFHEFSCHLSNILFSKYKQHMLCSI